MSDHAARPSNAAPTLATSQAQATSAGADRHAVALRVSLGLAVGGVLTQITYPLLTGSPLRAATVLSVLILAAASVVHAGATWGPRGALIMPAVAGGVGLAAETIGVHTGFPFGTYAYADTLGPRLAGVPFLVPLAWIMLAYPCLLLGRRLGRHLAERLEHDRGPTLTALTALTGGIGLAGWDLFLDPQMVAQGHWSWAHPMPALPGVPGVPLTNDAGWLLVSVLMIAALDLALPQLPRDLAKSHTARPPLLHDHRGSGGELIPAAMLAWTWCGSAVGNLVFFGRPWVALYGGLGMGVVVLPYLLLVRAAPERIEGT